MSIVLSSLEAMKAVNSTGCQIDSLHGLQWWWDSWCEELSVSVFPGSNYFWDITVKFQPTLFVIFYIIIIFWLCSLFKKMSPKLKWSVTVINYWGHSGPSVTTTSQHESYPVSMYRYHLIPITECMASKYFLYIFYSIILKVICFKPTQKGSI